MLEITREAAQLSRQTLRCFFDGSNYVADHFVFVGNAIGEIGESSVVPSSRRFERLLLGMRLPAEISEAGDADDH